MELLIEDKKKAPGPDPQEHVVCIGAIFTDFPVEINDAGLRRVIIHKGSALGISKFQKDPNPSVHVS